MPADPSFKHSQHDIGAVLWSGRVLSVHLQGISDLDVSGFYRSHNVGW